MPANVSESMTDSPARDHGYFRFTIHLLNFLIGILLLSIIIIYISFSSYSRFIFYLLPFAFLILVTESFYIFKLNPPTLLHDSILYPRELIRKSFRFQIAGSFASAWTVYTNWQKEGGFWAVLALSAVIWGIGVIFCFLAIVAKWYGFIDRLEEPAQGGAIALTDVESSQDTYQSSFWKRVVRFLIHVVHLSIAGLLIAFICINNRSIENSPFSLYVFPLTMELVVVELCYLFNQRPPPALVDGILTPRRLLARAFSYQYAGAFTLGYAGGNGKYSRHHTKPPRDIAFSVWVVGMVLLVIGLVGEVCGLRDWLEEPSFVHDITSAGEGGEDVENDLAVDIEGQSSAPG